MVINIIIIPTRPLSPLTCHEGIIGVYVRKILLSEVLRLDLILVPLLCLLSAGVSLYCESSIPYYKINNVAHLAM